MEKKSNESDNANEVAKEAAQDPTESTANAPSPQFTIEKIYVRDMSLEVPLAPQIFLSKDSPNIDIQIHTEGKPLESDGWFEATVRVTVTAKIQDESMFLVEATQAGLFQIRNVPTADIEPILGITCPNLLFPYVREVISDLVTRAGFPPLLLSPVNFELLYRERTQPANETTH